MMDNPDVPEVSAPAMRIVIPPKHLSCTEVASKAGCSQRTVRRAVLTGQLAGARTATGVIVIPEDAARKWIAARTKLTPVRAR